MPLTDHQSQFIQKRRKLINAWPLAGTLLILGFAGFILLLFFKSPLLINPVQVMTRLAAGTIEAATLKLMASLLLIVMLMMLVVMAALILFTFVALSNEKKLIHIIDEQSQVAQQKPHASYPD